MNIQPFSLFIYNFPFEHDSRSSLPLLKRKIYLNRFVNNLVRNHVDAKLIYDYFANQSKETLHTIGLRIVDEYFENNAKCPLCYFNTRIVRIVDHREIITIDPEFYGYLKDEVMHVVIKTVRLDNVIHYKAHII